MIAIPGMNPGNIVAGGGGDAGAGSAGSGKKGKGRAGADGGDEGEDADGGGKDSGACGQGGPGGCTNCASAVAAGDPVDVMTGEAFTIPKSDLFLPGAFALNLLRSYSSGRANVDMGMGFGWSHSLGWTILEGRRHTIVHAGDGRRVEVPKLRDGEEIRLGAWGLKRSKGAYTLRPGNEFIHHFGPADDTGTHRLLFVTYRNRGELSLQYERGALARVIDTVGRVILFERTSEGRVASLSVPDTHGQSIVFARYAYDNVGNLVAVADAEGHVTRYAYDDTHRLTRLEYPSGIEFHFVYGSDGRCVETWGAYPSIDDPALAPEAPGLLLDGSKAKGIYHCRFEYSGDGAYSEVTDSARMRRFTSGPNGHIAQAVSASGGVTTREFDEKGRIISVTDPNDATWRYEYDALDLVIRETDPEGNEILIQRDGGGREVGVVDPQGGRIRVWRDAYGEADAIQLQNGATQSYVLGPYGRVTQRVDERGARHSYEYDAHANLTAHVSPLGARREYTYDYWGRRTSSKDPAGHVTRYYHSAGGKLLAVDDPLGRRTQLRYDSMGNLVQQVDPDGSVTLAEYGGLNWQYSVRYPDGSEVRTLHNREGWPLYIVNERGERHEFEYEPTGLVSQEKDFGGRVTRYGYDALGRLTWFDRGAGAFQIERDKVGRIVAEQTPEDEVSSYTYNRRGELLSAKRGDVEFVWERDAIGNVTSERITVDGVTYAVSTERDTAGARVRSTTSLGHELCVARDAEGKVRELRTATGRTLGVEHDAGGLPVRWELEKGAAIVDSFDAGRRLRQRRVVTLGGASGFEPEWVGRSVGEEKLYDYSAADELIEVQSSDGDDITLEYDLRRHLLRRETRSGAEEFRADGAGNYYELGPDSPGRTYGAGSQLLRHGQFELVHDALGRLVEKRQLDFAGRAALCTRFEWNGWGLLRAVILPDLTRVEFQYDAFARRIGKRTVRDGEVVEHRHFVWDQVSMVHDVQLDESGRPLALSTYLYADDGDETPLGQRTGAGAESSAPWVYYFADIKGLPEKLIDGSGKVLAKYEHTAFGKATLAPGSSASTPFRAPGQQEDAETGLFYNRYRYYDPDLGRFISPDPIGLEGGLNTYAYGPNPIAWIDPMGWKHHCILLSSVTSGAIATTSGYHDAPDTLKTQPKAHTEQKFVHELLSGKYGDKEQLKGEKFTLLGEMPPCPRCHASMMRGAKESGADIEYKWKDKDGKVQTLSYEGASGKPSADGDQATKLKSKYADESALEDDWEFDPDAPVTTSANTYWGTEPKKGAGKAYEDMASDTSAEKNVYQPDGGKPYWSEGEQQQHAPKKPAPASPPPSTGDEDL